MSIKEELFTDAINYPNNNRIYNVHPSDFVTSLRQQLDQLIQRRFSKLEEHDAFEELVRLFESLHTAVDPDVELPKFPLKRIVFSEDEQLEIPMLEEFSLKSSNLITNASASQTNFFKTLKSELQTADRFDFMVSFIRSSGLQLLVDPFQRFAARGKRGRVLTSVYMNITQPSALRKLLTFDNIEVKIFLNQKESFHTKSYLFDRSNNEFSSLLVGSSNISQAALTDGEEWSIKLPKLSSAKANDAARERFEELWESGSAVSLDEEFIRQYEEFISGLGGERNFGKKFQFKKSSPNLIQCSANSKVTPNEMQLSALRNLADTRLVGEDRAVAIAATGTGKTYLAAFDAHQFKAKRVLFLAHRDELLVSAISTFSEVFGSAELCGKYTGAAKQIDRQFIFSTVQTLSRESSLYDWDPCTFDYMVVDEFHHAQAESYLRVINHFQPRFLLGLTATPERMDGRDVLKLCNYNIISEVRLRDALGMDLLSPFHYFGVADKAVDYDGLQINSNGFFVESSLVERLNTSARVDYVVAQINKYSTLGEPIKALGFCVNKEHARFMAAEFNTRGIRSVVLTGETSVQERQTQILNLQKTDHELEVIFTVDIFNEGIDIPSLNLLLFLRPTESSTIFIQQLGRGLRKFPGKEYVTVLDFIGNYQKSFTVPLALAGEIGARGLDKQQLARAVKNEFQDLPAGCYVELDEVAKSTIIEKLDSIRLDKVEYLKELYRQFRRDLGASPRMMDFLASESAPNPSLFLSKFGSLYDTKIKCGDAEGNPELLRTNDYLREVVERVDNLLPLKWPYEFAILAIATRDNVAAVVTVKNVKDFLQRYFHVDEVSSSHDSLALRAMKELADKYRKMAWNFGEIRGGDFHLSVDFTTMLRGSDEAKSILNDRLEYGLRLFRSRHKPEVFLTDSNRFTLYQNYTRNDIQFLSEDTAKKGSWREGVKRIGNDYFLFINLHKDDEIDDHLMYQDYFIDQQTFHWQSQNQTSHGSAVGQHFLNHKTTEHRIHLFLRKRVKQYGVTLPFVYLGEADYVSSSGDKPMSIVWRLRKVVPVSLYEELVD